MNQVLATPGPVALFIRNAAGRIELRTVAVGETRVEVRPGGSGRAAADETRIDVRTTDRGFEVHVEVPARSGIGPFGKSAGVEVTIDAPDGADVDVVSTSAEVDGKGGFGSVRIKTTSGDVRMGDAAGDVEVRSASGDVRLDGIGGLTKIRTASGDVHVGDARGALKIQTASGDVSVGRAGPSVKIQTASGDQRIGRVSSGEVVLQSASGDIAVGIERGSGVWLDVRSISGDVTSELEVDHPPTGDEEPFVTLRATSMSGDVLLRRADR